MKKSYQPLIYVVAAVLLTTVLFAFKAEEPKKEYATIQYRETVKKDAIILTVNGAYKKISTLDYNDEIKFLETLNAVAAEGWTVTSTDYMSTGAYSNRIVYLERSKQ